MSVFPLQMVRLHSDLARSIGARMSVQQDPEVEFWKSAVMDGLATILSTCDRSDVATIARMLMSTAEECVRVSRARQLAASGHTNTSSSTQTESSTRPFDTPATASHPAQVPLPSFTASVPPVPPYMPRMPNPAAAGGYYPPPWMTGEQWQYMYPRPPGPPTPHPQQPSPVTTGATPPGGPSTPATAGGPISFGDYSFDRWLHSTSSPNTPQPPQQQERDPSI